MAGDAAAARVKVESALMLARRCLETGCRLTARDQEEIGEALDLLLSGATTEVVTPEVLAALEGRAVIDGRVVRLVEVRGRGGSVQPIALRRGSWRLGMESDCWMDGRIAYVAEYEEGDGG